MATQLDARDLKSWEEAFQHPLPVVRKLELQLRKNINDNREQLRSLVGGSYRDLLGTADRIVEMDGQMTQVESILGDMGRKCNTRAVERVGTGSERFRREGLRRTEERENIGSKAQVKAVLGIMGVAGRLMKRGGDPLVAGKLLVLGRLIINSLGDASRPPRVLGELKKRLALLKRRFLGHVERLLVGGHRAEGDTLTNTLCAYALVTSSTTKDVLRHFLHIRFQVLESKAESPRNEDVMEMLEMYSRTLLDARDLFPRRLSTALMKLSRQPLLKDAQVKTVPELSLDLYGQWITEDVRNFSPYVRHEDFTVSGVREGLRAWAGQARELIVSTVQECLEEQMDAEAVLQSRHDMLLKSLVLNSKHREESDVQFVERLRDVFLKKLQCLARDLVGTIAIPIELFTSDQDSVSHSAESWNLALQDIELRSGAFAFRKAIVRSHFGQDQIVLKSCEELDSWTSKLDGFSTIIKNMRSTRWHDELDLDLDDLDSEESFQEELSKNDPSKLLDALRERSRSALKVAYQALQSQSNGNAASLLRLHRELDQRRRSLSGWLETPKLELDKAFLHSLHQTLARSVCEKQMQHFARSLRKPKQTTTALWDGTPPLPVQPSPMAFRFLTGLHREMSLVGNDLWSPSAVDALQSVVIAKLSDVFRESFISLDPPHQMEDKDRTAEIENMKPKSSPTCNDKQKDRALQALFDALYIWRACNKPDSTHLGSLTAPFKEDENVGEVGISRLRKSSNDYWKRTYLLFGLLSPHGL